MRAAITSVALLLALSATASADCPHSAPADGTACVDPGAEACTYTDEHGTRICSCRDGRWRCETMPPAAPRAPAR
ncbi:MAG: hypothetical protein AB7S26_01870 [Sandaracinaceae bacterium]